MAPIVSTIAIISDHTIDWVQELDSTLYQVDNIAPGDHDFLSIDEKQYNLLLIDDESSLSQMGDIIRIIARSEPLISVVVLTPNTDPDYSLGWIEQGAADVFNINEDPEYLVRRLQLVLKQNHAKRTAVRQNRNLNSVTVLSRSLHNANDPNNLIKDALEIISSSFNLMGLVIVLESGNQWHLRASHSEEDPHHHIYDVMLNLHTYDPIRQCIDKGMIMVYDDLSLDPYMVDIPIFDAMHSAIVVPLRYVNITLGAMMALGTETNPLTRDDIVIYEHLATHLGSAYQNVQQSHIQDVSAKTSLHLLRTWQHLSKVYTTQEVDDTVRTLASEITGVKHALVWLYNDFMHDPLVSASNSTAIQVFQDLYQSGLINDYLNQFDAQLRPLVIWLGRSNTRNIGELFQAMEGQQLILVPIQDEARLLGCILVSSNSNEQMNSEYLGLLEGIAHAAGQTLARNMLISYKDRQTERLEAITRSIRDGIFFVAEWQDVVFCNPQFTELTGIAPSQVLNRSVNTLIDELVNHSDNGEQTRKQLNEAIQQVKDNTLDQEYPIVEINIPAVDSRLFIEFIVSEQEGGEEQSWIGVLRSHVATASKGSAIPPSIVNSIIKYTQTSATNISRDLASKSSDELVNLQSQMIQQIKHYSSDVEQLLMNTQSLMQLSQTDTVRLTRIDPNKLLETILKTAPLDQYQHRLDVKTSIKDTSIYADRPYITQTLTNLIDVAVQLSDDKELIQIQMGAQANRFIFRVITNEHIIPTERINQMLTLPYAVDESIPYPIQLRLYLTHQIVQKHNGTLIIKQSPRQGMQFNLLIPLDTSTVVQAEEEEHLERIPERKLSNIMIYDELAFPQDVDYEFLPAHNYELIYCDQLDQVYNEINLIRVDALILTTRKNDSSIIDFVEQLRQEKKVTTPILILSTYNSEDIRVRSLQAGVDAYVSLPISNIELLAQIENLFERSKLPERVHEPLKVGQLNIDFAQRQVSLAGKNVDLTRIEYDLLCHLALKIGQTLTHVELLTEVWGPEYRDEKQYLWVNMSRLRRKLEKTPDKTRYIFTQPGVGYIMKNAQ